MRALSSVVARASLRRDASLGTPSSHVASRDGRAWQRCRSAQPRLQLVCHIQSDSAASLRSTALIGACALVRGRALSLAPRCVARGAVVTRRVSRWTSVAEVSLGTAAVRLARHVRVGSVSLLPLRSTALIGARALGAKVGGARHGTTRVRRRTRPHRVCVLAQSPLGTTPPFHLIGSRRVNKL